MKTNIKALLLTALILASTVTGLLVNTPTVSAALEGVGNGGGTVDAAGGLSIDKQVESWWYYNAMKICANNRVENWGYGEQDVKSGNWFSGGWSGTSDNTVGGYYMLNSVSDIGSDGAAACKGNNSQIVQQALSLWKMDPLELMCEIEVRVRANGTDCMQGSGDFKKYGPGVDDRVARVATAIKNKFYNGTEPKLNDAQLYYLYFRTFKNACALGQSSLSTAPQGEKVFKLSLWSSAEGKMADRWYIGVGDMGSKYTNPDKTTKTCQELADSTVRLSGAYGTYIAGLSAEQVAAIGQGTAGEDSTNKETCNLAGIGWIVCPVATFAGKITDWAYAGVEMLLKTQPVSLTSDNTNAIYTIWDSVRNLANIAFIVAFFMIIFSQSTSIGIGSYGIKKMLPRLIIAAILVNLSYYICAFGVDVSNILGAGIDGIIKGAYAASSPPASSVDTWEGLTANMLAAAAVYGGGAATATAFAGSSAAASAALLPLLVTALFAVVTALVVLIARQAFIILLIIVAPLAFVAYILPNTENLFDKWRKAFITMLMFYPVVALVFAGSSVAASIIRTTATDELTRVASLAVQFFPLFALPFLLKFSGGLLGKIAGVVNNPNKGPFDRLRKNAEGYAAYKKHDARAAAGKYLKDDSNYARDANGAFALDKKGNRILSQRRRRYNGYANQAKRDDIYRSAEERDKEGTQEYLGSQLAPDENAVPLDTRYASKMAGHNKRSDARNLREYGTANANLRQVTNITRTPILEGDEDEAYKRNGSTNYDQNIIDAGDIAREELRVSQQQQTNISTAIGAKKLDQVNRVIARGASIVDEVQTRDIKAAQLLENNVRLDGDGHKKVLTQAIGSTVAGMNGDSIVVTEAMQAASGATMASQAREVNTVLEAVSKMENKGLRSFLFGQMSGNFSAIKAKQAGAVNEKFGQKLIDGSLKDPAQFHAAFVQATADMAVNLTPQQQYSQEGPSVRALNEAIDQQIITDPVKLSQLRTNSYAALHDPLARQYVPAAANEWHEKIAQGYAPPTTTPVNATAQTAAPTVGAPSPWPAQAPVSPVAAPSATVSAPQYGPQQPQPFVSSPQTQRALRNMFDFFSDRDIVNRSSEINININNSGGVGSLSDADIRKVSAALGSAGVRDTEQQQLFEALNSESAKRQREGIQDTLNEPSQPENPPTNGLF